jgi:hypothetical protein
MNSQSRIASCVVCHSRATQGRNAASCNRTRLTVWDTLRPKQGCITLCDARQFSLLDREFCARYVTSAATLRNVTRIPPLLQPGTYLLQTTLFPAVLRGVRRLPLSDSRSRGSSSSALRSSLGDLVGGIFFVGFPSRTRYTEAKLAATATEH